MLVITDGGGGDVKVVQQLLRLAGVLASNAVDVLQDAQRAQRDVLKIANRRSDQIEPGIEGNDYSWLWRRSFRLSASRLMECIRFCRVTMPTMRSPSVTGTNDSPRPAKRLIVVPSESSGWAT